MEYFIKQNPGVLKSTDKYKRNALHLCALGGTLRGIKLLIEKHGFDMFDSSNEFGRNAFLRAADGGKDDQIKYFVKRNPEIIKSRNKNGWSALYYSVRLGNLQTTKLLVEKYGLKVSDKDSQGMNVVEFAKYYNKTKQLEYLERKLLEEMTE